MKAKTLLLLSLIPLVALASDKRPNIIIILADDMGYADIGCFGAEIETPNLDRLAHDGMRMSHFYNVTRCCPSRAALLSGLYPHQAGMGLMSDQSISIPSYQGFLKDDVITIPQLLKKAGYDTYISGKWHVGEEKEHWPHNYGFDRCFSFIHGAGSYFDDKPYRNKDWPWSDGEIFTVLDDERFDYPDGTYSTDLYTDYALDFINESLKKQNPFFLYLAYTAPHWPLHALPEDISKYDGKYNHGWEQLRKARYQKQLELGLFEKPVTLSEIDPAIGKWEELSLEEREDYANRMEVYAAMVDRMDQNIGRILKTLEHSGELENTFIVFISDNGGSRADEIPFLHERFDPQAPVGSAKSFIGYGKGWASASNTPFRKFKTYVHEGGISTPFIAFYPKLIEKGRINHEIAHITDLLPTCVELAEASYPEDERYQQTVGTSLVSLFKHEPFERTMPIGFEHTGNRALVTRTHKLVSDKSGNWELYDLVNDRSETKNLIDSEQPQVIADAIATYHNWAHEVGAFPLNIVHQKTIK